MKDLCGKSRLLTGYLELLLEQHLTAGNTDTTEPSNEKEGMCIDYSCVRDISLLVCVTTENMELQWELIGVKIWL